MKLNEAKQIIIVVKLLVNTHYNYLACPFVCGLAKKPDKSQPAQRLKT